MIDSSSKSSPSNSKSSLAAVILAAGRGTRLLGDDLAKPLVPVAGRPMVDYLVEALHGLAETDGGAPSRWIFVVGHQADKVRAHLSDSNSASSPRVRGHGNGYEYALQSQPLGTGDALRRAAHALQGFRGDLLVLNADKPLFTSEALERLLKHHSNSQSSRAAEGCPALQGFATLMTSVVEDPTGYGRILRNGDGSVSGIIEQKEATSEQLHLCEVNGGAYCFRAPEVFELLELLEPRGLRGELYLTDVVELARGRGWRVSAVESPTPDTIRGINTPEELAAVEKILLSRQPRTLANSQSSRVRHPIK